MKFAFFCVNMYVKNPNIKICFVAFVDCGYTWELLSLHRCKYGLDIFQFNVHFAKLHAIFQVCKNTFRYSFELAWKPIMLLLFWCENRVVMQENSRSSVREFLPHRKAGLLLSNNWRKLIVNGQIHNSLLHQFHHNNSIFIVRTSRKTSQYFQKLG